MPRDATPPPLANIDAEQGLLGCVLMAPDSLDHLGHVRPEHFYDPVHADIFIACRERHGGGEHVSPITMKGVLAGHPGLSELGGVNYIARLAGEQIHPGMARDYARVILDFYARRELVSAAETAITTASALTAEGGAEAALAALDGALDAIRGATQRRASSVSLGRALYRSMERMAAAREEGPATPTGLASLDRKLGGLFAGDMLLLGGRPSMGKTALAQSIARRIAKRGRAVAFASLEMQSEDLAIRMASEELRERSRDMYVPYETVREGRVSDDDAKAIMEVAAEMERLPVQIIESHVRRLRHLSAEIRRHVNRWRNQGQEIGVVIIDYLTLAQPDSDRWQNDNARISHVSQTLKGLAAELKVPFVVLAQLNRQVEARDDKHPVMSDLRDSGSLEQDADSVIFCYREEYYEGRKEPDPSDTEKWIDWRSRMDRVRGRMEIIVAKKRMGQIGTVGVQCDLATNSIWDEG